MYFSNMPKTLYQVSPPSLGKDPEFVLLTDITRNYRFKKDIIDKIVIYDEYVMKDGETPELLSEMLYDSPYYHWVLMLLNDRYNYRTDFAIPSMYFDDYIASKYGTVELAKTTIIDVLDTRGLSTQIDVGPKKSVFGIHPTLGFQIVQFIDETTGEITTAPDFSLIDYATPVFAYDLESQINERKTNIKIISRSVLTTVLDNFRSIR
jgi:hypothetical protein